MNKWLAPSKSRPAVQVLQLRRVLGVSCSSNWPSGITDVGTGNWGDRARSAKRIVLVVFCV